MSDLSRGDPIEVRRVTHDGYIWVPAVVVSVADHKIGVALPSGTRIDLERHAHRSRAWKATLSETPAMSLFHQIPNAFAILIGGGVYKQAPLFEYKGQVFAKYGAGYVGLRKNGTTHPTVLWTELDGYTPYWDDLGRAVKGPSFQKVRAA